ncbi:MAG: Rieske 2Fe-2S domain-containing protein [SAR202 cluster bacterium]|nr:Rieske 2Fe-2S domain-containing protein [SAR202 cluster bacterium]|tara:strand:- start:4573 stop:5904 length:1332 start_codon:yes stop_codon:yes gene_type:complete
MLSKEENEILTRVGPGTVMGDLMREYWMPAMTSDELPAPDCDPVRLKLLGEDLIAFRATSGKIGVVGNSCPHRGASLFYGRNEEEGLRCVYHGWKFDTDGHCVDMPSEPPESRYLEKVRTVTYQVQERGGLIWVYMGARSEPPPLPSLVANMQPEGEYTISAYYSECNWMQSLEGDYDTSHVSWLHAGARQPEEIDEATDVTFERYALKTRWARHFVTDTEFGCTSGNNRPAEEDSTYWRIAHFLFPFYAMIPASFREKSFIAVVPMDDQNCMRWHVSIRSSSEPPRPGFGGPKIVDGLPTSFHLNASYNGTGWYDRFKIAGVRENDYLIDRDAQRAKVGGLGWSGLPGRGQDNGMTESMGVIYKREQEHLAVTDTGIIRMRRLLVKHALAFREDGTPPPAVDDPELYKVRSVSTLLPNGINGIEATQDLQWGALSEEEQPAG